MAEASIRKSAYSDWADFVALGFVVYAVGRPPFPSLADVGCLCFYPLLLWALLSFPAAQLRRGEPRRVWLDATMVTVAGFSGVWYRPRRRPGSRQSEAGGSQFTVRLPLVTTQH